ncbi:MAG: thioesterase family protein [Actinomycetota bacterium]
MADLRDDTETSLVERGDDTARFRGALSADWAIWGPMGGYVASLALRAAGAACGRQRPISINANFLAVAAFDEVDVDVTILRATRVATCVRAVVRQGDRVALDTVVWGTDTDDGLAHHTPRARPDVPEPEHLPSFTERLAVAGETAWYAFWDRLDYRPTRWIDDWDNREPTEPEGASWYRFPAGTYDDPWLDACRVLITTDLDAWGVATNPHVGELAWFAPTTELTCRFLQSAADAEWLLSWGEAPVGDRGVIGAVSETWSRDGRLLATGGSTMLCRPAARRPEASGA